MGLSATQPPGGVAAARKKSNIIMTRHLFSPSPLLLFALILFLTTSCKEGKEFRDQQNENLPGTWEVELYYKEIRDDFGNILAVEEFERDDNITVTFYDDGAGETNAFMFRDNNGSLVRTFLWRARTSKSMVLSFGGSISSPDRIIFQDPIIWSRTRQNWESLEFRGSTEVFQELNLVK